jgi:two-component system CheB/CheR fusion protein
MSDEYPAPRARYVVGIGASAGGLEALESFFDHLPKDTGMAFVVVQHLSPDFKSLMDELLARRTELPVRLVEDGVEVEPDHVYLIPPRKEMIISGRRLLLSERDRQQELSLPIDVFFRSLAQDCGPRAVAIVLSGGGSDGSRGIRDVHDAGGLVIVQDNATAQFDGMPKTARDVGVAHWVLAPEDMPAVLLEHARRGIDEPGPRGERSLRTPRGLESIYGKLEEVFGLDFTHYKPSTVTRRIERRLQLARSEDIATYALRLQEDRTELDTLYRDLLIGVTRFFRNEEAFAILEQKVLPDLFHQAPADAPLRVWVAGCATGEEAYSLAILLHEQAAHYGNRPVKIFASDVHPGSLSVAGRGIYDKPSLANISPSRLERFFLRHGESYQLVPEIRQMVVFAQHNVIRDAPFTRMDLITCRNLLIYLQPAAQQKALSLFHFALRRGGIVFLGPSETPGALASNFEPIDRHWRIYRKYSDVRVPVESRLQPSKSAPGQLAHVSAPASTGRHSLSALLGVYDSLLDDFMPPSLLLNERGELVQSFSGASRFLRLRDGRQDLDILEIADPDLKMVLVGGLQRARRETSAIVFQGLRMPASGDEKAYDVKIRRVRTRGASAPHVLVSFLAVEPVATSPSPDERPTDVAHVSHDQLRSLETELAYTKENLQGAIEELETSNEELQTTNEELLTSNEELQSTNEELQSVNEELYTVNAEYQRKIAELTELANDMDNLLSSTDIGTIFLDSELRIRKFTPKIAENFNLVSHDVGRPIEAFTHTVDHPELGEDLKNVLASGKAIERDLRDGLGRAFFLRILPYRAKGTVHGVVLTLIDITSLKAAEDALFHERYLLNSLLASVPDSIYFKDANGKFIRLNGPMAGRLGLVDPREAEGKTAFELPHQQLASVLHAQDVAALRKGQSEHYVLQRRTGPDGEAEWDIATRLPLVDPSGRVVGILGILRDVTELKRAEERVHDAVRRRDEFLAMLSHELRNPLGAMVTATALLRTEEGQRTMGTRLIQVIDRQSQQMSRLLDDLLDVSRVTQNRIELRKERLELQSVARDAVEAVRNAMEGRNIRLVLDMAAEPLFVSGDAARLHQIHANLLANAAKYTNRGGLVVLQLKREGDQAVVRVRDDGVGIRAELMDSIFDLFVQSPQTLDRSQGGLGVGLTLVRALVTMHGGTVSAHSDGESKGSEFVVRLPVADGEAIAAERSSPTPTARLPMGSKGIVVEDNRDSREMLCELLVHAGLECHSAATGEAGLTLIERVSPEFAIIDLGLPGMDGFELARRIRGLPEHAHMRLVALTGYGQPADRANAEKAGFDAHLVKPLDPVALLRLLRVEDGHASVTHSETRTLG